MTTEDLFKIGCLCRALLSCGPISIDEGTEDWDELKEVLIKGKDQFFERYESGTIEKLGMRKKNYSWRLATLGERFAQKLEEVP